MKNFIKNLQFLFRPSFWLMNHSYSELHDKKLNALMDKYPFTSINCYTACLGNVEVWIANYPYGVGIYGMCRYSRPSRLTIVRMNRKLIKDQLKEINSNL